MGSQGTPYLILPKSTYCSCDGHLVNVVSSGTYPMCKHALAAFVTDAMDNLSTEVESVSDEKLAVEIFLM